jgi:ribose 5-phosphate isomerase B
MNIFLATDHAGFAMKEQVKVFLLRQGTPALPTYNVLDYGPYVYDPQDDYPDTIQLAMKAMNGMSNGMESRGIIFGGSGQGEAMVANRFPGIRATVYYAPADDIIALSREHNNANVLSIGARFVNPDDALVLIDRWLSLPFSGDERHVRRINKIDMAP